MNCTFTTSGGKTINAVLTFDTQGEDILATFACEINYAINWDIDLIVLRYHPLRSQIKTGRDNVIELDSHIGEQLVRLAVPGLKLKAFESLLPAEQQQVRDFAVNGFSKPAPMVMPDVTVYPYTQNYKGHDYLVTFSREKSSTSNNVVWVVAEVERSELVFVPRTDALDDVPQNAQN